MKVSPNGSISVTSNPTRKHGARSMERPAQVSSLGRFRNVHGVVRTPLPKSSGCVKVRIHKKDYHMHRLVALAFALPRTIGQDTVNRRDGDPSNNRVDNLEWASQAEQVAHSYGPAEPDTLPGEEWKDCIL